MHECPECGQACYCSGDLDDCPVFTEEWAYENCVHPESKDCEPLSYDDFYDDFDPVDDYYEDGEF